MNKYTKYLFVFIIFLSCLDYVSAQKTIVFGKVTDAETKEVLPFVNISFQNSKIGTITDIDGNYRIETYYATDSLAASFVGYLPIAYKVKKDKEQQVNFEMRSGTIKMEEIVIKAPKKIINPAHAILKNVIDHKSANNREKLDAYEYEAYNKVEFDINNIGEEYQNSRVFKPFQFIFDNVDTTGGKPYLPIFITEAISQFYYKRLPKSQHEIIKASKVSGVKNQSVQQFLGDMYQNVNVYDNYITVFGKSFVSPVADFGLITYRYYLIDSTFIDNKWCYKLKFTPKREHELTFDGEMWISDTTYAVKQIQATVSGEANINFIKDFAVYQEYNEVAPEVWMLTRDELLVDFELTKKALGFYGRKTSSYKDFVINTPKEDSFFEGAEDIIVEEDAGEKGNEFWQEARHVGLSQQEQQIYTMIDTLQTLPAFKSYLNVIQLFITGYKVIGNFEFGPYFTTYSFNRIEGNRIKIGGRTSNQFSTKFELSGHVAYGFLDKKFKYDAGFRWKIDESPRQIISGFFSHDVEQLGQSENAWQQDNIISSVFRRTPFYKLNGFEEYTLNYEREWFQGFSNKISLSNRKIWTLPGSGINFDFINDLGQTESISDLTTTEVKFYTRFAYKEKYVSGEFERVSLGTKYPIFQAQYSYCIPGVLGSDFEYHKLKVNISDRIRIGMFGHSDIILEAGKVFGTLPYPLLFLHNGNETYSFDISAFNLMNYYEFVSDEYVSLSYTHHFNGAFLNKIPLMNKLKWREVVSSKIVTGKLDPKTSTIIILPSTLTSLEKKPYYEVGVGLENIFQFLRFDALWRLSYIDKDYIKNYEANTISNIVKFGIRGTIQFEF